MGAYATREELDRVLVRLAESLKTDSAFLRASRGRSFSFCMSFPDLGTAFYGILRGGHVEAGLGRPPEPPTIDVAVNSQVFDDIFMGRVNPARAVMRGQFSFSGDAVAGMRFQGLVPDFGRLYRKAKAGVDAGPD